MCYTMTRWKFYAALAVLCIGLVSPSAAADVRVVARSHGGGSAQAEGRGEGDARLDILAVARRGGDAFADGEARGWAGGSAWLRLTSIADEGTAESTGSSIASRGGHSEVEGIAVTHRGISKSKASGIATGDAITQVLSTAESDNRGKALSSAEGEARGLDGKASTIVDSGARASRGRAESWVDAISDADGGDALTEAVARALSQGSHRRVRLSTESWSRGGRSTSYGEAFDIDR